MLDRRGDSHRCAKSSSGLMALDALLDAIERLPAFSRFSIRCPRRRARLASAGCRVGRRRARRRARAPSADALLRRRRRGRRRRGAMARGSRDARRRNAVRALSAARRLRRSRAAHGGRRRARRDARAADARRGARAAHDRARAAREDAHAARAAGAAHRAAQGRRRIASRELAEHLERIGFERVPMVEDVAQFSMRGGIFDVYSFGMAEPVRAEFWGDEIEDLRHFDLGVAAFERVVDSRSCCPSTDSVSDDAGEFERGSILSLFPPDTLVIVPRGSHIGPELKRTWDDAQHHVELARRRGEDVPRRDELFETPDDAIASLRKLRIDRRRERTRRFAGGRIPDSPARGDRPRHQAAAPPGPRRNADDHSLRQRRTGRASRRTAGGRRSRSVAGGAVDRRAGRRIHRGKRDAGSRNRGNGTSVHATAHGSRDLPARTPHSSRATVHHGDGVRHGVAQAGRLRRASRARRRHLSRHRDDLRRAEHDRGRRRGVRGRRPAQRAALPHRSARALPHRATTSPTTRRRRACTSSADERWAQQRDRTRMAIQEMTVELLDLYARRKIAMRPAHVPDTPWQRQLESAFLFEDTPDQRTRDDAGEGRHGEHAAHGSLARRRRGLRQDRDRRARGVQGGADRSARSPCSCRRRFSPISTSARSPSDSPTSRFASRR